MTIAELLSKYWIYIALALVVLLLLIVFIKLIVNYSNKEKSFKEDLEDTKSVHISITIDFEERIVEKYYLYDQKRRKENISLDEFFVRFDKTNAEKLRNWLSSISTSNVNAFNKTRRIELVMYSASNFRRVYLVELEGYNAETKRYFLIFKDITESASVLKRVDKLSHSTDGKKFFERVNERLLVCDDNSNNFVVAIKYKEYEYAKRELQSDILSLIDETVFQRVKSLKNENEIIHMAENGTIYLFSSNVVSVKKFKKHLRNLLIKGSGEYNILTNKFKYAISLLAGYNKVNKEEKLSFDKCLEAETALNSLLKKPKFSDRIQFFDEHLKAASNLINNKLLAVEKVINETLFSINYVPIINTSDKVVSGYQVQIGLPHAIKMEVKEFVGLARQRYFVTTLYNKIFSLILRHKDAYKKPFFFSFDFIDLDKVMEAYAQNEEFNQIELYFCLEFSNTTMQNNDLISIERKIAHYKKSHKVRFGINYNTLTSIYLNARIYSLADVVLLSGQLIECAMDNYSNESLLEVYTKVAASYAQEVIGLNVNSLAVYELLIHYNVKKVGGIYLTPYITNDKIVDKFFLRNLETIDNKTY